MGALKWGLKVLVLNCAQLPTIVIILRRKSLYKSAQKATNVHNCRRLCTSALSPHLRAPIWTFPKFSILARNFQSRSKLSIQRCFFLQGFCWCCREGLDRKFQSTIDRSKFSILKAAVELFQSTAALWGLGPPDPGPPKSSEKSPKSPQSS